MVSLPFDAQVFHEIFHQRMTPSGIIIATSIVAVTDVSAGHQDGIGSLMKCPQHELGIYPAGTGDTDQPDVGRILQAAQPRQVGPGIGAPVTGKGHNLRLPIAV